MNKIYIKDIRMHAYHGVMSQEREVGNDYIINLTVEYPIEQACISDDVNDTMNYAEAAEVVKEQMAMPSNLLENVAYRIGKSILQRFPKALSVEIDLRKIAPPMPIDCEGAGIILKMECQTPEESRKLLSRI